MEQGQRLALRPIETNTPASSGRYQLYKPIGEGGFCKVYIGFDAITQRDVAIKEFPASAPGGGTEAEAKDRNARMLREILMLGRLNHPGLPEYIDAVQDLDGNTFLVMEHVHGETLEAYINRAAYLLRGRRPQRSLLPRDEMYSIARQLFQILEVLHAASIIHRDVKPANIMYRSDGDHPVVKLIDFGIGKSLMPDGRRDTLTRQGFVMGTPSYLAPEQAVDSKCVDQRADLYAAGCVLYGLVTGRLVLDFEEGDQLQVKLCVELQQPLKEEKYPSRLVDDMNPLLERLILDLLERDVDKRVQSAQIALRRLDEAEAAETTHTRNSVRERAEFPTIDASTDGVGSKKRPPSTQPRNTTDSIAIPMQRRTPLIGLGLVMVCIGAVATATVAYVRRIPSATGAGATGTAQTAPSAHPTQTPSAMPSLAVAPTPSSSIAPSASSVCVPSAIEPTALSVEERSIFDAARRRIDGAAAPCLGADKKGLIRLKVDHPELAEAYRLLGECMRRERNEDARKVYLTTYHRLRCEP